MRDIDRRVLVIIPFRDGLSTTLACLQSLENQDVVLEVRLIDNDSRAEVSEALLAWTKAPSRKHRYLIEPHSGGFNFAAMNNRAFARHSSGFEFVLFLNNDVELTDSRTVRQMVAALDYDEKVAFCGIRLCYPDGKMIQHGGIKIGLEPYGSGYLRPRHMDCEVDFVYDDHAVTAVTFACAMTRVSVFESLKGLDEVWMPNGLGDVEICLRALKLGYRNFYLGSTVGIHHESLSRRSTDESLELSVLYQRHGDVITKQLRRQMSYDTYDFVNREGGWTDKPLRYRVADRLNDGLKNFVVPIHRILKRSMS